MSELNVFSKRLKKSQEVANPKIKVLIEDSKSGFDFYKGFIKEVFPDVDFDFVEEFNSKGERLGGYNYVAKKISNVKLKKNENLLVLFDSVLPYFNRSCILDAIIGLSDFYSSKIYYFSPPSVESLFCEFLETHNSLFNYIQSLSSSKELDLYSTDSSFRKDGKTILNIDSDRYEGKSLEKIISQVCFDEYASKRMKLSKNRIPEEFFNLVMKKYKTTSLKYLEVLINSIISNTYHRSDVHKYNRLFGGV